MDMLVRVCDKFGFLSVVFLLLPLLSVCFVPVAGVVEHPLQRPADQAEPSRRRPVRKIVAGMLGKRSPDPRDNHADLRARGAASAAQAAPAPRAPAPHAR